MENSTENTVGEGIVKKRRFSGKYFKIGMTAFVVIACSLLFYFSFFDSYSFFGFLRSMMSGFRPFIIGAVLAYLLKPICAIFEKWFGKAFSKCKNRYGAGKWTKVLSIGCTAVLFLALVYVLFAAIIPQVIDSVVVIAGQVPTWADNAMEWLEGITKHSPAMQEEIHDFFLNFSDKVMGIVNRYVEDGGTNKIVGYLTTSVKGVLVLLKDILVGAVSCLYILYDRKKFVKQGKLLIYSIFNKEWGDKIVDEIKYTDRMFSGFINGKLIDSLIIGILCFIILSIFRIPYSLLISVIIGVTNIIPFFGPFIGAIPSGIILLMVSPIKCLYFVIIIIILQQFDGNILGPKILGNTTGISSFWVLFSITFFGSLFGFMGMVIGVPLFAVLYDIVSRLVKKGLAKRKQNEMYEDYIEYVTSEAEEKARNKARKAGRLKKVKKFKINKK